ncbi:MAG TPA: Ku protein [Pseudonocardiaceae bacterium]|jgi:DNA end-binding protein Ku|nr:Ku protein [Pseudonocardiaceae bacterium]
MARPVWSGTISLGLVTVPVALYSATRDHSISFHQIQRGTTDRIRMRRVNERTGDEVEYSDIAKGYETDDNDVIEVEPEELDDVAPGRSRSLEIDRFVDLAEIDPVFFDRTYWLAPSNADFARAYHLLLRAMADTGQAGVAMLVLRGRQHPTVVRAGDGVLVAHTMRFADEIRDPAKTVGDLPTAPKLKAKELDMARELVTAMSGPWQPGDFHDTYQEKVRELLADKEAGREPSTEPAAEPTKVIDLADALARSVRKAGRRRATPDPESMSKAELDDLAKELGIRGRSRMTKPQLVDAVRTITTKAAS